MSRTARHMKPSSTTNRALRKRPSTILLSLLVAILLATQILPFEQAGGTELSLHDTCDFYKERDWEVQYYYLTGPNPIGCGVGHTRDGFRHGQWTDYYINGTIISSIYEKGVLQGFSSTTYSDGSFETGMYSNDKRVGLWTSKSSTGSIEQGTYNDNNEKEGKWKYRGYDDVTGEMTYSNGMLHGTWTRKFPNGQFIKTEYRLDMRHGPWLKTWSEEATQLTKYSTWTPKASDKVLEQGEYRNGLKEGKWIEATVEGRLEDGTYVAGKREGDWYIRTENGLHTTGTFVNDKRSGTWMSYPIQIPEERAGYMGLIVHHRIAPFWGSAGLRGLSICIVTSDRVAQGRESAETSAQSQFWSSVPIDGGFNEVIGATKLSPALKFTPILTLIHPLIFQPHITANTSRYTRCSVSICANFSINGRNLWSGQFGMCS